jgi:hypothetical protein
MNRDRQSVSRETPFKSVLQVLAERDLQAAKLWRDAYRPETQTMKAQRALTRQTMPPESEADVQRALIAHLCASGWLVVRINGAAFTGKRGQYVRAYVVAGLNACAGFPDLLALRGASFRLFELKKEGGKLSPAQQRFQDFAARFGVQVEVIEGRDDLDAVTAARL